MVEARRKGTGRLTLVPDPRDAIPGDPTAEATAPSADDLLTRTARGDEGAFGTFYDLVSSKVFGLVRRVVRDPATPKK